MARGNVPISFTQAIAQRLRLLREAHGYSRVELTKEIDFAQSSIMNHESGLYAHTAYVLGVYAEFYGITVDDILKGNIKWPTATSTQQSLSAKASQSRTTTKS